MVIERGTLVLLCSPVQRENEGVLALGCPFPPISNLA